MTRYYPGIYGLKVQDVIGEDQGLYSCEASSVTGTALTSCYVHVDTYRSPYTCVRYNFYDKLYELEKN